METWGDENYVVGLPFARLAGGVGERWVLFVDRAQLTVGIGFVLVGVEDLSFVAIVSEKESAIAASLAVSSVGLRCAEF